MKKTILLITLTTMLKICFGQSAKQFNQQGNTFFYAFNFEKAVEKYTHSIEAEPNFVESYIKRGYAKFALANYEGAIKDFNTAITMSTNNQDAYYLRGNALFYANKFTEAITDYNKLIKLNSNYKNAHAMRGEAKCAIKDYLGAINDYMSEINNTLKSKDKSNIILTIAMLHTQKGIAKFNMGDYRSAAFDFKVSINLNPNLDQNYLYLDQIMAILKNGKDVIANLSKATELNPDCIDTYFCRGMNYNKKELYNKVLDDFETTIELDLSLALANFYSAFCKGKINDFEGALNDYGMAIQFDSMNDDFYLNRGDAKFKLGDNLGAIDDYTKALELGKINNQIYLNRADAHKKLGHYLDSLIDFISYIYYGIIYFFIK